MEPDTTSGGGGNKRFARTELLLGRAALERLAAARVAVVGLGAVGSYALEGLARTGIGHLRVVDFDVVRPSNINRQLYALESTLGRPKVELARERILDINPACDVEAVSLFAERNSHARILAPPLDVVIDAIDSVGPKVGLIAAAVKAGIPIVSSMGAARRMDPLAVRVGDISETDVCPLARFMRRRLKRQGVASGVRCVYSVEPVSDAIAEPEPGEDAMDRGRKRKPLGSYACLTGVFGLVAAREALSLVLSRPATT